jgi:hypothetical protein
MDQTKRIYSNTSTKYLFELLNLLLGVEFQNNDSWLNNRIIIYNFYKGNKKINLKYEMNLAEDTILEIMILMKFLRKLEYLR